MVEYDSTDSPYYPFNPTERRFQRLAYLIQSIISQNQGILTTEIRDKIDRAREGDGDYNWRGELEELPKNLRAYIHYCLRYMEDDPQDEGWGIEGNKVEKNPSGGMKDKEWFTK